MLDKNCTYTGYSKPYRGSNQPPVSNFKRVKIIFEDDKGWYVESLTKKDSNGGGIRYSVKKHCFVLRRERPEPLEAFGKWRATQPLTSHCETVNIQEIEGTRKGWIAGLRWMRTKVLGSTGRNYFTNFIDKELGDGND
jgi:hypothetical protein